MLADMGHMSLYKNGAMTWAHHLVAFASYCCVFFVSEPTIRAMMMGVVLLETSSVCIQLSWFANKAGYAGQWWFRGLAALTLLQYFIVRCLMFPVFIVTMTPKMMWLSGAIFSMMNWVWFTQLVGYAQAVVKKAGAARLE